MVSYDSFFLALMRARSPHARAARQWLLNAWLGRGQPACRSYLDRAWRNQLRHRCLQRFWELYLVAAALQAGLTPVRRERDEGPDLIVKWKGYVVGIEAVCPTAGDENGAVRVEDLPPGVVGSHPTDTIEARIARALREKANAVRRYLDRDRFGCDTFVFAVNLRGAARNWGDALPPVVVRAAFGVGPIGLKIRRSDLSVAGEFLQGEDENASHPGAPKMVFSPSQKSHWRAVSGILWADPNGANVDPWNHPGLHGGDLASALLWVRNPFADTPLDPPPLARHEHAVEVKDGAIVGVAPYCRPVTSKAHR